jgi:hypothetical protein
MKIYIKSILLYFIDYTLLSICRSQSLGEQLHVFEAEAAILKSWLTAARSKLNSIKQLSSSDLKSIATVRGKIDKILVCCLYYFL